ncbi:ribosomal small subunit pseudouridylate synthase, partial [mine drainage metagenome]
ARTRPATVHHAATLLLNGESVPLCPRRWRWLGPRSARLTLREGRYHQARRMFAALGNHVLSLHRERIGALQLGDLPAGAWRPLATDEIARIFDAEATSAIAVPSPAKLSA